MSRDVKLSFLFVWIVLSQACALTALLPFVLPEQTVYWLAPDCVSKTQFGLECVLCGMTMAFVELCKGNVSRATELNRAAPLLYVLFLLNWVASVVVLWRVRDTILWWRNKLFP